MKILVLNAGSSSLKYRLFKDLKELVSGQIEHIGEDSGVKNHYEALLQVEKELTFRGQMSFKELDAIGHRVVHGGEKFTEPVKINDNVIEAIKEVSSLAPLHNPANLQGILMMRKLLPNIPQVVVFDTAFHQTMEPEAYLYAIPYELYEKYGIRRYGFHGTSHAFVAKKASKLLNKPLKNLNLITIHLGNGASVCAIKEGKSIETSMGFTPLEGLVMGTRSGDTDPEIPLFLQKVGLNADTVLNKQSGLKGICGQNDMREVEKLALKGDEKAKLAIKIFVHRIKKYIGAYSALLGRVDAVIFTAGIGEHSLLIRSLVCDGLEPMGMILEQERNKKNETFISTDNSMVKLMVIPTNEELEIAHQTEMALRDD
ncbi:acetate/propionate family kinase [Hydrogenimonas thermophila]|uniref:Acetate kinase n=1 Tax=Hydrogenimonas thermophila TaxID=223786 RepID=A0A1I5QUE9_9BACT|nr:acetate kinase [Hydrogenimonas thermophila]WOE69312.1 acetate kinase [Hydrogenimonas thermophila]WOE71822.1 acetate kinase [Hydrogenimonas thermophila]SFP49853.1 acetate kinase [Hydrogenimonas thermophila]